MKQEIQTYLEKVAALESSLINLRASLEALRFHEECYQIIGIEPNYSLGWVRDDEMAAALDKPPVNYSMPFLYEKEIAETCRENYPNYFAVQTEELLDIFHEITESDGGARWDIFFKYYKAPAITESQTSEVVYKPKEVEKAEHWSPKKSAIIAGATALIGSIGALAIDVSFFPVFIGTFAVMFLITQFYMAQSVNKDADAYDAYMAQLRKYENYIRNKESSARSYISSAKTSLDAAFQQAAAKATPEYKAFAQKRNQGIAAEIGKLELLIKEGEETLQKLYDKNILPSKYRNLTAVCAILEYFETDRCSSLGGADGAYNLYEAETRQNLIILKLDEVVERLDELKATMYRCCLAIERVSKQLNGIQRELKQLNATASKQLLLQQEQVKFAALTTAYTAATAANTEAIKYLALVN